jgi:hypothetical protein
MPKSIVDEDLYAGLLQAKEKPRYFAIISKGADVLKMVVQKKWIKDAEIQQLRREFKGNNSIFGVCFRNGPELVLQIVGEEPALKLLKIKDFITEQTGASVKPQWQLVAALPDIGEDHESAVIEGAEATSEGAAAPQVSVAASSSNADKVRKALEDARPKIEQALAARPELKNEILALINRIKQELAAGRDNGETATASFRELVTLLGSARKSEEAPVAQGRSDRLVTLQRSRLDWDSARKRLHAQLQDVAGAVMEECEDPDEYDQVEVQEKVKTLDTLMERLDTRLIDVLDQALNAEDVGQRGGFEKQAAGIIREYLTIVNTDPMVAAIDDSGLVSEPIKTSMTKVLSDLAGRLAS